MNRYFVVAMCFKSQPRWRRLQTTYTPILNVGSTMNGSYSVGWQKKRLRSLICLLVAITHKGWDATRASRTKAVVINEACFLPSPSNRNHGSSSLIWSAVFCALCRFAYCKNSFTCCRPLGSSPEVEHFEIFLQVRLPPSYILHRESFFRGYFSAEILCFPMFERKVARIALNSYEDVT